MRIKPQSLRIRVSDVEEVLNLIGKEQNYSTVTVQASGRTIRSDRLRDIISWLPAHEFDIEVTFPDKKVKFLFECKNPDLEMEEAYWMQFRHTTNTQRPQ